MLISKSSLVRSAAACLAAFTLFSCSGAPDKASVDKDEPDEEMASKPVEDTLPEEEEEVSVKKKQPELSLSTAQIGRAHV